MFGSRVIEKNRKPSKFRDNKEKDVKQAKKQKPQREPKWREYNTQDYESGC